MCRVLNMSEFWIFVNFLKYDRVLNMSRDAIMEGFWIFQDSEYTRFLSIPKLHKVLNMPEYGWAMPYAWSMFLRVLNKPPFFLIIFYLSFPLKVQKTTKQKTFLHVRKIKRKSNLQLKTEPLPNLHLTLPRQHINLKKTYF